MTCYRTHICCTANREPEVEALLERVVPAIGADVLALGIPELAGVCLGGGYGRGEGGVCVGPDGVPRLFNDLDFFVFSSGAGRRRKREIDRAVEPVARRWTRALGIDVDFGPVKNTGDLGRVSHTLMFQELKHGYWQVCGEADVLAALPALRESELPPLEGARLLLNRGMGLLMAAERVRDGAEDAGFVLRNLNKAVLGGAEAQLICAHRYRWRARERLEAFGALAAERGLAPERVQEYAAALEFRRTPRVRPPDDWRAAWERARGFWCESVAGAAGCAADAETETVLRQLHADRSLHGRKGIRNLLRWVVKTHSPGSVCDWLDAPELRMLRRIYRLLAAAEPDRNGPGVPEERALLYRLWRVIS